MRNIRVKVVENRGGYYWLYAVCEGRKQLFVCEPIYVRKANAIRYAKVMAKRIGIKFDSKIVKLHGC